MIFNFMIFITASTYWYITGYALPAVIGYIVLLMFNEKLAFYAVVLSAAGICAVIYYIWFEYFGNGTVDISIGTGISVIYMLVLLIKAKKIFDGDEIALD